ncbi:MAG TPA: autotransporter-associated beta strand repeat-containing protein, partial [Vicinamibacterales bacterium]|nr:autotransporter-associated beta strand repeat-containing protein [Vicinamibacterales bacterium]
GGGGGLGGGVFVAPGGTITISGTVSINGNRVGAGTGAAGGTDGSAFGAGIFLGGGGKIVFASAAGETQTVADDIADEAGATGISDVGAWSLVKTGAGTLVLSGVNRYTLGTTVDDGILSVSSGANLGTGDVNLHNTGTLAITGSGAFGQNVNIAGTPIVSVTAGQNATLNGVIADDVSVGAGGLTVAGGGTVTLGNARNSYSGGTTVVGNSTIAIGADGALGAAGTGVTLGDATSGGTLSFADGSAFGTDRAFTLGAGGGTFNTAGTAAIDITGSIDGSGGLGKAGSGTLTLFGANTYTGPTIVGAGVLRAGAVNVFSTNGAMQVDAGATLDLNSRDQAVGSLLGGGSVTLGTGTLTAGGDNTSTLFSGVISGSGALVKSGSGALVLAGSNSYTGGTLVSGGALIGTTASLQGGIQNNAQVIFSQNANGTYAGTMTGTGSLATTGTGTLTLTANNTYSGGTSIGGGSAISISADTALGASSGGVALGDASSAGTLTFTNAGLLSSNRSFLIGSAGGVFNTAGASPVTIGGAVTGSGGLAKTGTGVLVLAGANRYTGPTSIAGGVLRAAGTNVFGTTSALLVGAGGTADLGTFNQTVGSIAGSGSILLGGGTLTTGGDGTSSLFGGGISGPGSLIKTGGGRLALTGANSYSGGTQVLGGALIGDTTSLQGNILNNALVQFDQNADGTYAGSMSGSGALAKTGDGTLTLSGNNTYSGGTLINGGAVAGTASSLRGLVVNNARLTLGVNADSIFAGTLSGSGLVTKTGTGTLTLNGTQTLSGLFNVAQGTLNLNGIFGGSLDVASGATLRASGVILGSVNVAGSLFAVPPPGTPSLQTALLESRESLEVPSFLTIGRDLTATPGSLLDFAIGPGATPTILVGGTANLNGTRLNISAPSIGTARSASFLALAAANGLSMVNSNVTTGDPNVIPVLNQNRNSLFVTLLNLNVPLRSVSGPATVSVADALDRSKFGASGDGAFIIRELTALDDRGLADALEQIGGQLHATVLQTAVLDTEMLNDMVRDEIQAREMEDIVDVRWWGETACQRANFKATDRARGGNANVCTGAGGADRQFSEHWTLGGGGSFTGGNMGIGSLGSGDYTAPRAFGYVGYKPRGFGVRAGGSAARSSVSTKRQIVFQALLPAELGGEPLTEGVDRKAESEQKSTTTDSWSEIHDSRKRGTYTIEATLGVRHARISRGSFSETGALALSLNAAEEIIKLTQTNLRFYFWRRSGTYRPFVDANYRRELANADTAAALAFSGLANSDFKVQGIGVPLNMYSGRLGMTFVTRLGNATLTYEFKQAPGQRRQTLGLRVRFK